MDELLAEMEYYAGMAVGLRDVQLGGDAEHTKRTLTPRIEAAPEGSPEGYYLIGCIAGAERAAWLLSEETQKPCSSPCSTPCGAAS
jgi:hypothetical protein